MDRSDALCRSRCRERRLNNSCQRIALNTSYFSDFTTFSFLQKNSSHSLAGSWKVCPPPQLRVLRGPTHGTDYVIIIGLLTTSTCTRHLQDAHPFQYLRRDTYAQHGLCKMSVCLSVCHTLVLSLNGYTYPQKFFTIE